MKSNLMSPFWLAAAAITMSLTWLVPNHSLPWPGFHSDAWVATILCFVAIAVFLRAKFSVSWHWLPTIVAGVMFIPMVQYAGGMSPVFGVAWIHSIYVLGLLLAMLTGAAWESHSPTQCLDFLFLAIISAAVVSVGLQLYQFFDLEPFGPWTLLSPGARYYANMAQPNQLASLLLLGILGCAWMHHRRQVGPYAISIVIALLLLGLAMTESRTGWLNVGFLVIAAVYWRRLLPNKDYLKAVLAFSTYFALCVVLLPSLNEWGGNAGPSPYRSALGDVRWTAWGMFLQAAIARPWFGFGWGQLAHAQFFMLDEHIAFGGSFLQSHNLFIDLILWNGIPLGLAIALFLTWWAWSATRRVNRFDQVIMVAFLMVLGTHAMLEYPLQYAYFLLPAGLVAGCLNVSLKLPVAINSSKGLTATVLLLSCLALGATVLDYLRVERSFYGLRFELKGIDAPIPRTPPETWVLTQWRDHIIFARMDPQTQRTSTELAWMRNLVSTIPSGFVMYRFAHALAVNNEPAEAEIWLRRICQVNPENICNAIKLEWEKQSILDSRVAAVKWPWPTGSK